MTALIAAAWLGLLRYCTPQQVSPDGVAYMAMANGKRQPLPFHLRWLLPKVLGDRIRAWEIVTVASLFATAVMLGYMGGWFAAVLFLGLPMVRTLVFWPILVDAPALACAAGAALLATHGFLWPAVALALVGSAVKEQTALFAALAAWNPWLLLGLAAPAIRMLWKRGKAEHPNSKTPLKFARTKQAPRLLSDQLMILPWGVCLAVLLAPTPAMVASVVAAYALLFTASDSTRVYQWACIPVCIQAASVVPEGWLIPLAVVHLFNPFKGEV